MRATILTTSAAAQALVGEIDKALGYPRDGTNVGSGTHAPAAQSRTLRWDVPRKHPTRNEWAVAVEARIDFLCSAEGEVLVVPSLLTKAKYDALKAKVVAAGELAADWFPVLA